MVSSLCEQTNVMDYVLEHRSGPPRLIKWTGPVWQFNNMGLWIYTRHYATN